MMTGFVMLVVAMNTTMLVLALEERRMTASGCSYRMQLEIALGWTPILTVPIMCHQLLMLFCLRVMLEDQLQIPDLALLLLEVGAVVSMLSPKTPPLIHSWILMNPSLRERGIGDHDGQSNMDLVGRRLLWNLHLLILTMLILVGPLQEAILQSHLQVLAGILEWGLRKV